LKLGSLVDLETITACENISRVLKQNVNIVSYKKSDNVNINLDHTLNYRATDINNKLAEADLLLLVNLDLKNEIPLFNARLSNSIRKSGVPVGVLGSNIDCSFNYEHIGFDLKDFITLLEGNNKFLNKILQAKSPLILFGENCST
jgi:NADH dehydrogenase (ubiquinone) Fe-S protein 1